MNGVGKPTIDGESPVIEIVRSPLTEEYGEARETLSEYARTIS